MEVCYKAKLVIWPVTEVCYKVQFIIWLVMEVCYRSVDEMYNVLC